MLTTTLGIEYPEDADPITDYPAVAAAAAATIDAALQAIPLGWTTIAGAFTYNATDGHTFVLNTPSDLRNTIAVGARFSCVQGGTTRYFIVTAVAAGTITLYGGTTYTLTNVATTVPRYSSAKAPAGFPLDPTLWTETFTSSSDSSQSSPAAGTWYNIGSLSPVFPIGAWLVDMAIPARLFSGSANCWIRVTMSTANNTESDKGFTSELGVGLDVSDVRGTLRRSKILTLAAKTTYFLNATVRGTTTSIWFYGSTMHPVVVTAVSAYL